MIPPASFFDPGENGFDGADYALLGTVIVVTWAGVRWIWKWIGRRVLNKVDSASESYVEHIVAREVDKLREEMRALMAPIQPDANGGNSLPDNMKLTAWCADVLTIIVQHGLVGVALADIPPKPDVRHNARTRVTDSPLLEEAP